MARLRKFVAYRRIERPYTRKSKYRKYSYVRANPNNKIIRFDMGELKQTFPKRVDLVSKTDLQIRHNALESARQTANKHLEKTLGKTGYHFKIRIYPHHVLRENALASGAGADRLSTGMKHSFGKPIGIAAQVNEGQSIFSVDVQEKDILVAKKAMERAIKKLPNKYAIVVNN
ncbi:50S ribosomal protein L16 [Candidatus Woesearchaeota archaeon]|nr:50S ribosomal protein L16 [Candidatus Woesearchaeota archaeon]